MSDDAGKSYLVKSQRTMLVRDGAAFRVLRERLTSSESAAVLFGQVLRGLPHEEMYLVAMTARGEPKTLVKVSQGGLCGCAVKPADILRVALLSGLSQFLLAHNHPSGDPTPSHQDVVFTRDIARAAELVGLVFLDHLVMTEEGGWRSIRDVCGSEVFG